jgi:hypothetical protein
MRLNLLAVVAVLGALVCVQTADAWSFEESYHQAKLGYHRNEAWPWPFICPDRIGVREPFRMMVDNGWRRQNLLGQHHFNAETNRLTTAGELRVHWIMTQAPAERRSIFVERAASPDVTSERMAVVRGYAAQVSLDGQEPQAFESHLVSEGRPASVVDATNVRFYESMRPPVLPPPIGGYAGGQ